VKTTLTYIIKHTGSSSQSNSQTKEGAIDFCAIPREKHWVSKGPNALGHSTKLQGTLAETRISSDKPK
jgi:hypothetical protein